MRILKIEYNEKFYYVLTTYINYLRLKRHFKGTKTKIKKLKSLTYNAAEIDIWWHEKKELIYVTVKGLLIEV